MNVRLDGFKPFHAFLATIALGFALIVVGPEALAFSRIKDLTDVEGVRENQLVGYGLVVGLNGTGDGLRNAPFTRQSIESMLERLGVQTRGLDLPAFSAQGTRIDVTVSALGDAKSLQGGMLLVTPLLGADGEIYAVAQGPVAIGGFSAGGAAETVTRGVPTSGRISNGAIIERELKFDLAAMRTLRLSLRNPDFTTARRIAQAINTYTGGPVAKSDDPKTVTVTVPPNYNGNIVGLLTEIEQLRVDPDQPAKVLVDEDSGIIVMGADVRVSPVAIAQGNLTIRVTEAPQVSQPAPFSEGGNTEVVPRTAIDINEDDNKLLVLDGGVTLQSLVDALNALGVGPRDMIAILQAIKASGALQAEIEVM